MTNRIVSTSPASNSTSPATVEAIRSPMDRRYCVAPASVVAARIAADRIGLLRRVTKSPLGPG